MNDAARDRLSQLLGLPSHGGMQDWPLEVADASRLVEFCDAYESPYLTETEKFALMQLILFSLDEAEELPNWGYGLTVMEDTDIPPTRIRRLLSRDFLLHLHTVNYWRLPDVPDNDPESDYLFGITPLMRQVWEENFKPEYRRWLDADEADTEGAPPDRPYENGP
jgi:hypothetical protein